jgi:hypothetical protein
VPQTYTVCLFEAIFIFLLQQKKCCNFKNVAANVAAQTRIVYSFEGYCNTATFLYKKKKNLKESNRNIENIYI